MKQPEPNIQPVSPGLQADPLQHWLDRLRRQPHDLEALYQLGMLYREREQLEPALDCFARLGTLAPQAPHASLGLAHTWLQAGDPARSRQHYADFARLQQALPDWPRLSLEAKLAHPDLALRLGKKLQHDIAWLQHLQAGAALPPGMSPEGIQASLARYRALAAELDESLKRLPLSLAQSETIDALLAEHAVSWQLPPQPELLRALSPAEQATRFVSGSLPCLVLDDALRPQALSSLYDFCLRANIWQNYLHGQNYLCAYPQDGANLDLIHQLAAELRRALPELLGGHGLKKFWLYKYTSDRHEGVQIHADSGAVNVNLWLTPNQGNLASDGGLLLYDVPVPLFASDAEFFAFNRDLNAIMHLLQSQRARSHAVPYRQNRMVIFDANLLHQSMPYHFRPDYALQRINLTLMFGRRGRAQS